MRELPEGLSEHLASGATTLCRCWKLTKRDGSVAGFTDHDVTLNFDGIDFEPAAGFTASEIPASVGLSVDTSEISGVLVSPRIEEGDLRAGLYDGAQIELYLVNWADVTQRVLLEAGTIGEITRSGRNFTAEVRSLSAALDQERGRVFQVTCDVDLGSAPCGVDLNIEGNRADGTVDDISGARTYLVSGLNTVEPGRLERGRLTFTSGDNAGASFTIRADRQTEAGRMLELWSQPARIAAAGDEFTAFVGCDKTFATCRDVFSNTVNFRGFPHIPGSDFALSYVSHEGEAHDGGPLIS